MTAKFSGDPKTTWISESGADRRMYLMEDFHFTDKNGSVWLAPAGSLIDGASIPRAFWSIIGPPYVGDYRRASIVHDVACVNANARQERRAADRMFYQACRAGGCSTRSSIILYIGVRIGAWWKYKSSLENDSTDPRIVEPTSSTALRSLLKESAESIFQSKGEIDDVEILEELMDQIEPTLDQRFDKAIKLKEETRGVLEPN
ncbi:DUF1353 domain-containing protein [Microbulbifer hydrolyticus]|uniref:DUF1353 domain-containing protein n=1 Tax=Microbulbifer hydrolyticus TaxID=48074 RepID=A0A6P1TAH4_9GAMM|nr:DUF1353 domain-containing protein [Microbulbifer hydrolyticus]MBB5210519.1 hypothetical protein [Microbulbifer hydrolyticus]QHQ39007.1 DUF1353 domain-containing protein [Microbulbifer hydrolyticus]